MDKRRTCRSYLATKNVASHVVAEAQDIPERFLLKILKPLVSAGILSSLKEPNGGYCLARPAKQITLLEVVEGVNGPMRGYVPMHNGNGSKLDREIDALCRRCADQTCRTFERVRITDLPGKHHQ